MLNLIKEEPFLYYNFNQILKYLKKNEKEHFYFLEKINKDESIFNLVKESFKNEENFEDKVKTIILGEFYKSHKSVWKFLIQDKSSYYLEKLWILAAEFIDEENKTYLASEILAESMKSGHYWGDFIVICEKFEWLPQIDKIFKEFLYLKRKDQYSNWQFLIDCVFKSNTSKKFIAKIIYDFLEEDYKGEESEESLSYILSIFSNNKALLSSEVSIGTLDLILTRNLKFTFKFEDIWKTNCGMILEILQYLEKISENFKEKHFVLNNSLIKNYQEVCEEVRKRITERRFCYNELKILKSWSQKEKDRRLKIFNLWASSQAIVTENDINELVKWFDIFCKNINTLEIFSKTFLIEFTEEIDIKFTLDYYIMDFGKLTMNNSNGFKEFSQVLKVAEFIEKSYKSNIYQQVVKEMKVRRNKNGSNSAGAEGQRDEGSDCKHDASSEIYKNLQRDKHISLGLEYEMLYKKIIDFKGG